MAELKGYDHLFVDSPPDELLCLICMLTARDPQQSTCCGKVYCKVCLEDRNFNNIQISAHTVERISAAFLTKGVSNIS